jgi:cardiolipin synthase
VEDKQVSMWSGMLSVPNFITLARLCMLPVFLYLLFARDQRAGAALLLGVLSMTDWVDGWFARRFNQVSPFGSVFDPTVDRLLFVVSAVSVLIDGVVPWWLCIAILIRELAVGAMMVIATLLGMERFPVSNNGKWYTFLLMMAVPFLLLGGSTHVTADFGLVVGWLCAIPGLALSYYTAFTYVPLVRTNLRKGRAAKTLR